MQEFAEELLVCLLEFIDGGRDFFVSAGTGPCLRPPCWAGARAACGPAWVHCTSSKILRFAGCPIRGGTSARTEISGKEIRAGLKARGIPVGLVLDGANRHDVKLVDSTLVGLPPVAEAARDAHRAACGEQGLCRDAGYDAKQVRETLTALSNTAYTRPRGEEVQAKKTGQKSRRWVVERTHSGLSRFRYLLIRWAKNPENYSAILHFACARIAWYNCLFG